MGISNDQCPRDMMPVGQLRLLFWHYLYADQRARALYACGLAPSVPTTPVPQTIESALIARASPGQLAALWDAVTAEMPAAKRKPNPFRCRCGRLVIRQREGDTDPWCEGCSMSAAVCDCVSVTEAP